MSASCPVVCPCVPGCHAAHSHCVRTETEVCVHSFPDIAVHCDIFLLYPFFRFPTVLISLTLPLECIHTRVKRCAAAAAGLFTGGCTPLPHGKPHCTCAQCRKGGWSSLLHRSLVAVYGQTSSNGCKAQQFSSRRLELQCYLSSTVGSSSSTGCMSETQHANTLVQMQQARMSRRAGGALALLLVTSSG